jgi:hypothetical protein
MNAETIDPRLEGMRAVLWAMSRLLHGESPPSRAACFELRALTCVGLQLADDYFDSPPA